MAKQHFYSRVPARASMYNRTDGFDTFALSDGLGRIFIERELSEVYENKLGKADMDAVRQGKMPAVYSQSVLKSGQVVQSCVSYIPKDYTGERSAYLCHSLILSDAELQTLHSRGNAVLNPQMLVADVSGFDFTTQTADSAYPEKNYEPSLSGDPAELIQAYTPDTLKAFLFALLSVLCAKGKGIYFKLPCSDEAVSREALDFINRITAVIPYHLRKELSFVTYITDPGQYAHVKLRCISESCPEPPKNKGIFVDLGTGLVTGMPASDVVAKAPVSFFYSLLDNGGIRDAFLLFVDNAVKTMPNLEKLSMKALSDLVFLFAGASGLFDLQTVLPTDGKVYDFFATYEKYRDSLSAEYRRNVYKCLERYPKEHLAIPRNIFTKLSKLYPTDDPSAKRIAVNMVLELIHTDIMRDKLFLFLKNNYNSEAPEIQAMIDLDLCSVFYGGFLQEQILSFFGEHFAQASETVRDTIFEKLMLSIRTASVQEKILQFIEQNYGSLSEKEKQEFYTTAYEMLPECDELAARLVPLLNRCLAEESLLCRQQARTFLTEALDADCKKKEHKLLPLLCAEHGFCYETVLQLVLGPWNNRKVCSELFELIAQRDVVEKTRELLYVFNIQSSAAGETNSKLMLMMDQLYAPDMDKANLYQWLEADTLVKTASAQHNQAFSYMLRTMVIQKAIAERLPDAFNIKLRKDGISIVTRYAEENYYLTAAPKYQIFALFLQLIAEAEEQRARDFFCTLEALCQHTEVCGDMADTIFAVYLNWETQAPQTAMLYEMGYHMLKKKTLLSEDLYTNCKASCGRDLQVKQPKVNPSKIGSQAASCAGERILQLMAVACNVSDSLCRLVCQDTEGLQGFVRFLYANHTAIGEKWILSHLYDAPAPFVDAVKAATAAVKPHGNTLLRMLFKK